MPIYKPSELRQFLDQLGINPKKALSQNFLIDGNIIRKIVKAANVGPQDQVLEIGPGPGSLTEALLDKGAFVLAVEKDPILAQALERLQGSSGHLEIHCEDILRFSIRDHIRKGSKAKVIANLPYHITTPIVLKLVLCREMISHIVIMVQEEVARRMVAQPGTSDYGSLTLFLNFYTHVTYGFSVSRNCFYPIPKVDSAVVIFELKEPPKVSDETQFFVMTRKAFEQRRKMLRSSLRALYLPELIEQGLKAIDKSPLSRPEELSVDEFIALFEYVNRKTN